MFIYKYIYTIHTVDCVSTIFRGKYMSENLRKIETEIYQKRRGIKNNNNIATIHTRSVPGTIQVFGNEPPFRYIIFYNQFMYGTAEGPHQRVTNLDDSHLIEGKCQDTKPNRLKYFKSCLTALQELIKSQEKVLIRFPKYIACNLEGGHWPDYKYMINDFDTSNSNIKVIISDPDDIESDF